METGSDRLEGTTLDLTTVYSGRGADIVMQSSETANGKDSENSQRHRRCDPPAYATFSGDDVASIFKFIQTGLLQMLR